MISKIKSLTNSEDKKRLFENFFSLSVLQGANYILPLITLPYLVRVLGPEKFGLIAFAQAFIQYFNMLTDYGFQLSATRKISIHRENKEEVSEIFSSVMTIKLALLILSFAIMTSIVFSFVKFKKDWLIYYLTFGMVAGQVLFPVWFFQGMERMKYITFLNIAAKLIFTICIFIFVRKVSDYIYVPLINSLGSLAAGSISIYIILKNFKLTLKIPSIQEIKCQLKEGWYIFISSLASIVYMNNNVFLLGLLTNNTYVGYYSVGEKLIRVATRMFQPVLTALFPFVSRKFSKDQDKGLAFFFKFLKIVGVTALSLSALIFFLSKDIVATILGGQYYNSVVVVKILSLTPFFGIIGNLLAYHLFINIKLDYMIPKVLILAFVINLTLNLVLIPSFKHVGASIALAFTESFIPLIFISIYFFKKGDNFNV